jgi:hypothetical protein
MLRLRQSAETPDRAPMMDAAFMARAYDMNEKCYSSKNAFLNSNLSKGTHAMRTFEKPKCLPPYDY